MRFFSVPDGDDDDWKHVDESKVSDDEVKNG